MIKKPTLLQILLFTSVLVFFVKGCKPFDNPAIEDACHSQGTQCLQLIFTDSRAVFDHSFLKAEQITKMEIVATKPIEKIWLEATNMQMGSIPIHFEEHKALNYQATLLVGLCSEPVMEWVMYIRYQDRSLDQQTVRSYWSSEYL